MKVIKIVVDEMPRMCMACTLATMQKEESHLICFLTDTDVSDYYLISHGRSGNCPLELDLGEALNNARIVEDMVREYVKSADGAFRGVLTEILDEKENPTPRAKYSEKIISYDDIKKQAIVEITRLDDESEGE